MTFLTRRHEATKTTTVNRQDAKSAKEKFLTTTKNSPQSHREHGETVTPGFIPVNCGEGRARALTRRCGATETPPSRFTGLKPGVTYALCVSAVSAGFSLVEILLAILILGLGLIMIAAAYPIAIHWTSQNAESTIGQVIAQDAASIIQAQYAAGSVYAPPAAAYWTAYPSGSTTSYILNTPQSYPVANSTTALYYWTAFVRQDPAGSSAVSGSGTLYDVYIFVFNKGDVTNGYNVTGAIPAGPTAMPQLYLGALGDPAFPIGSSGVDTATGQVFQKIVDSSGSITMSGISGSPPADTMIYAPPATGSMPTPPSSGANPFTGQSASPLIYVYVFTVNL